MMREGFFGKDGKNRPALTEGMRRAVLLLVAVVAASALFFQLSIHNNKYGAPGDQAINGLLYVSEASLSETPVRYLCDGWEFYADVLLDPTGLAQARESLPVRYLAAGQYATFALGDETKSGHGSATYVMTLMLPDEPRLYELDVPEVYSAYRLYIGNELVAQVGDPDPTAYCDATRIRQVTFTASGETTIIMAVSNQTALYSGMVYPLAFGQPDAVGTLRDVRLILAVVLCTLLVLGVVCAAAMAFLSSQNRLASVLVGGVMLCGIPIVSYEPLHALFELPVLPWHAVEALALYIAFVLLVAIHNRACAVRRSVSIASTTAAAGLCALVAMLYMAASSGDATAIHALAWVTATFKIAMACYVVAVVWIARDAPARMLPFLVADTVFATAMIWDRIASGYEPIIGGWFAEWGLAFLAVVVVGVFVADVVAGYLRDVFMDAQQRAMSVQLAIQAEHLKRMEERSESERRLRHDFRHHLHTVTELAREGRFDELARYGQEAGDMLTHDPIPRLTANVELNAMLQHYRMRAISEGVEFRHDLKLPTELGASAIDIGIIVGNALENAVDAAVDHHAANPSAVSYVAVAGQVKGGHVVLRIENVYRGPVLRKREGFLSTKHEGRGVGIDSIRSTVGKLGGLLSVDYDGNVFTVIVSFPSGNPGC